MMFFLLLVAFIVVVLAVMLTVMQRTNAYQNGPLAEAASDLGLVYHRGKFTGYVQGYPVRITSLDDQAGKPGVLITLETTSSIDGEILLSGPGQNAGAGVPEVKLTSGYGSFDAHFWIIRSIPRSLVATFFDGQDALRQRMMDVGVFGRWGISGNQISFQGYGIPSSSIDRVIDLLAALANVTENRADES